MVVEQVGHVDTSLLIDAPTVHLADQRVPVLPPCPPLPPLSPPPLLAETSFHAAGTTLQCPEGSIPSLGLTPSFHPLTIIWLPDYVLPLGCPSAY